MTNAEYTQLNTRTVATEEEVFTAARRLLKLTSAAGPEIKATTLALLGGVAELAETLGVVAAELDRFGYQAT